MVQVRDELPLSRSACKGWVESRVHDQLGLLKRRQLTKVPQELEEAQTAWQIRFAEAPKHPQVGLEQREQTLGPILVDVLAGILFLCRLTKSCT
jgi:hypothetical protein